MPHRKRFKKTDQFTRKKVNRIRGNKQDSEKKISTKNESKITWLKLGLEILLPKINSYFKESTTQKEKMLNRFRIPTSLILPSKIYIAIKKLFK